MIHKVLLFTGVKDPCFWRLLSWMSQCLGMLAGSLMRLPPRKAGALSMLRGSNWVQFRLLTSECGAGMWLPTR